MIRRQTMNYRMLNTTRFRELPREWLIGFAVWFALILPFGAFWFSTNSLKAQQAPNAQVSNSQTQLVNELNSNSPQARTNAAQTLAITGDSTLLAKLDSMTILDSDAGARQAASNSANQIRKYLAQGAG